MGEGSLGHPGVSLFLDRSDGLTDHPGYNMEGDLSSRGDRWINRAAAIRCSSTAQDDIIEMTVMNRGTLDSAAQLIGIILYADASRRVTALAASQSLLVPRSVAQAGGWESGRVAVALSFQRPAGYEPQRAIVAAWDLLNEGPSPNHRTLLNKLGNAADLFLWTAAATIDSRIATRNWNDDPLFEVKGNVITLRGRVPVELRAMRYDAAASPMIKVKQKAAIEAEIGPITGGFGPWVTSAIMEDSEVVIRVESNFGGVVESNQAGLAVIKGLPAPNDPTSYRSDLLQLWMDDHPSEGVDNNDFIVELRC